LFLHAIDRYSHLGEKGAGVQHNLKIEPTWFAAIVSGQKKAEVRRTDRPFAVGDDLMLYVANAGEGVLVTVTHILALDELADLECARGYAVLSVEDPRPMRGKTLLRQMECGDYG
jgi:hypothetical protein